jgi:hypothetical protein
MTEDSGFGFFKRQDNVQKHNTCINISSSQNFRAYLKRVYITSATEGGEGSASRLGCYISGGTEGLLLDARTILDLEDTCSSGQDIGPIHVLFRPSDFFHLIINL